MGLRYYQEEFTPAVMGYIAKNKWHHPLGAAPTGTGKSHMIADLTTTARKKYNIDILILTTDKKIIKQNHAKLDPLLEEKIGIYCAGLDKREREHITIASIQSVYKKGDLFTNVKMVIIDEAHLISPDEESMYQTFFKALGNHVRVGLTATPFRLGTGYIYGKDMMFDELVYDYTTKEKYLELEKKGYLAKLVTKETKSEMVTEGVKTTAGDFNEKDLAKKNDLPSITKAACAELIEKSKLRKKGLVFAIDIKHAEHITETLIAMGDSAFVVHSKSQFDNDKVIEMHKEGKFKWLVNVGMMTTGYDDPSIDVIGLMRPTKSPVFHVQTAGRGARPCEGKENCLILDFAGNTAKLGPVNDVHIYIKGKGKKGGEPITKTCPECDTIVAPAVRKCPECGHKFDFKVNLNKVASEDVIVDDGKSYKAWIDVTDINYSILNKKGVPPMVKVTYICGIKNYNQFVCVEHKGWAKNFANHWVKVRGGEPCSTVQDLLDQKHKLKVPARILVSKGGKYPTVEDITF